MPAQAGGVVGARGSHVTTPSASHPPLLEKEGSKAGPAILLPTLSNRVLAFTGTMPEIVPGGDNITYNPLEGVEMLNLWMRKRAALRLEPVRLRNPGKDRLNVSA